MSVAFTRISNATVSDIIVYDPAAERRADSLGINWNTYFDIGSQEILYQLQWGWWPKYVEQTFGAYYFKNNPQGLLVTAFDPLLLVKNDQTLIRLDVFKAVEQFYQSLVTDVSNINEVDQKNFDFAKQRYTDEWQKALQLSNFYNLYGNDIISSLEENYQADVNYYNGDRRYM